jgi:hypothetical protein
MRIKDLKKREAIQQATFAWVAANDSPPGWVLKAREGHIHHRKHLQS